MLGRVSESREAIVAIEISGPDHVPVSVEAVIDTGFTGYVIIPSETVRELALPAWGIHEAILGDGQTVLLKAFLLTVLWHGEPRLVIALESEGGPLLGMSLLWNSRMTLDVFEGGDLLIEPLSNSTIRSEDQVP